MPLDVDKIVQDLHENKVLNLDVSLSDLFRISSVASNIANSINDPSVTAGWYVVGGDHYAVICGAKATDISQIAPVAESIRGRIMPR
jgi:hypothetical protein